MKIKLLYSIVILIAYTILGTITSGNHYKMFFVLLPLISIITAVSYRHLVLKKWQRILLITGLFMLMELLILLLSKRAIFSIGMTYTIFVPIFSYLGTFLKERKYLIILYIFLSGFVSNVFYPRLKSYTINYNSKVDVSFPEIALKNIEGQEIDLSQGIVVLDFWYSKCKPCLEKMPAYNSFYRNYKGKEGVKVYSVNAMLKQENVDSLKQYKNKFEIEVPILFNTMKEIKMKLGVVSYPRVLILKDSKIIFNGYPILDKKASSNLYQEIDNLLKIK